MRSRGSVPPGSVVHPRQVRGLEMEIDMSGRANKSTEELAKRRVSISDQILGMDNLSFDHRRISASSEHNSDQGRGKSILAHGGSNYGSSENIPQHKFDLENGRINGNRKKSAFSLTSSIRDKIEYSEELERKVALVIILTRAGLDLDPNALKRLKVTVPKLGLIPWAVEAIVVATLTKYLLGLPWVWGFLLGSVIAAVSPAVVVPCLFRLRAKGYGVAKGIPTLIIAVSGIDDAASVAIHGIVKSIMFSHDALWYQIVQGPIAIIGGLGFGVLWGWLAKYVPEKGDPFMVPLRVLMLLGGGLLAVFGSEAIELGGAGPLAVVAAAFVSCYFWQKQGWEVDDNPVATAFEIFWMLFEPILFAVTGTQIKINELDGRTVYLGLACLISGIVIRIIVTVLVGIGSKLNLKEKVFIALSWMAKATVQAALGPTTLDKVDPTDPVQVSYAETVVTMCVLSILLTAPAGAILISLSGPKLLTKTTAPVAPPDGWKARRHSIRDISIINEDPDLEETANERKP
ncbi:na[+]/H[+] hydrogen antiporter 1 isoform X2 [Andrena cerasifolii]|uniref:na[+]/H[+] hydrogen antiporter 1 isoform X2 n=1 Tax=Andrena cerasifolii TaxID=2819439 RepID=UPI0040382ECB